MMIMYCILAVFTLIYLVLAAFMDLKERLIFVFPIVVLHALWSTYLLFSGVYDSTFLSVYWIVNLIVYLLLNHFGIWGGGDSDLFLLMGNVCLGAGATMNGYMATILECMCLCVGLGISMGISRIEAGIKKEQMTLDRGVAVVPGVAVVMTVLLVKGLIWRFM